MIKFKFAADIFEDSDEFFGFKYDKRNQLRFLLPKFITPKKEMTPIESFKLLATYSNVVKKYYFKNKHIEKISEQAQFYNHNNKIHGYISLIIDYLENDNFILFDHFYANNDRKINWQKTLQHQDILIQDNRVIYNSFISKNKTRSNADDFYKIYMYTFSNAWKIFFQQNFFDDEVFLDFSIQQVKAIINQFIDENFRDREIQIAHILKGIYDNFNVSTEGKNELETEYCTDIQNIWEFMVESLIPKEIKEYKEQIQGCYRRISDKFEIDGLITEIDHCVKLVDKKRIFILDSKFYSTYHNFNSHNQPKSESINKQETYKKLKEIEYPDYQISNFFVFPKNNPKNKKAEYFSDHILKKYDIDHNFLIHCIALDFSTVCQCFIKNIEYKTFLDFIYDYKTFFNLYQKTLSPEVILNLIIHNKIIENKVYDKNDIAKMIMFMYENLARKGIVKLEFEISSLLTMKTKETRAILKKYGWTFKIAKKEFQSFYKFIKD